VQVLLPVHRQKQPQLSPTHKRNSAITDKPRNAFRGQSRSLNIAQFQMLGIAWFPISVPKTCHFSDIRSQKML